MTKGVLAGVAVLLVLIVSILAVIAYTAFVWARRGRRLADEERTAC